ncbi:hypothetical protein SEA_HANNACONDA_131 [Mycobacterium phage Hannaconda]|nr:hypothetical protein SEA_HANNACONDA_131 [Mycobacterium phage Hannaconda]QPO16740.1 hypothetical protein SEA_KASHFLOW_136 [Mycobacterium phage KashFlow]
MLDVKEMTPDELFAHLGVPDMPDEDRVDLLAHMHAWSRTVLPGPNQWWLKALLLAAAWRKANG